jgi:hypothetical protein
MTKVFLVIAFLFQSTIGLASNKCPILATGEGLGRGSDAQNAAAYAKFISEFQRTTGDSAIAKSDWLELEKILELMKKAVALSVGKNKTGQKKKWIEDLALNAIDVIYRIADVRLRNMTGTTAENGAVNALLKLGTLLNLRGLFPNAKSQILVDVASLTSWSKIINTINAVPALHDPLVGSLRSFVSKSQMSSDDKHLAELSLERLN